MMNRDESELCCELIEQHIRNGDDGWKLLVKTLLEFQGDIDIIPIMVNYEAGIPIRFFEINPLDNDECEECGEVAQYALSYRDNWSRRVRLFPYDPLWLQYEHTTAILDSEPTFCRKCMKKFG